MKVSLSTIRFFNTKYGCGPDPFSYGVDEIVRRIGLQLGAVESVENIGEYYDGIVVAKVVSCLQHPDADRLKICMIDDGGTNETVERGGGGFVQVVCGAPNVESGQLVAWLPPGTTVPSTRSTDPFQLEAREIRGKISNGMLGSPKELGLSDDHEGILVIHPEDVGEELSQPGTHLRKLYGLDDVIIDCENKMFTHRPDCFGQLGVAREIAGIFGDTYTSPDWYTASIQHEVESNLPLTISNNAPHLVARFCAQAMDNIQVADSPMWLKSFLNRLGLRPINNVVDLTNYFMLLTAQPLHAFDYDKLCAVAGVQPGDSSIELAPRLARDGEKVSLLNGKKIELTVNDLVIAVNDTPVALAGIMGGSETEVDGTTSRVVFECANFDMYAIRRTSMRHGLFTDAVTRFNKGQSPLQNDKVLAKIVDDMKNSFNAKVASEVLDTSTFNVLDDNLSRVTTTVDFINQRLGSSLSAQNIKALLENVEFIVAIDNDSDLIVTAPFWRMDIAIAEDIVEEVGRLYGYSELPVVLPNRSSKPAQRNNVRVHQQSIRDLMTRLGAHELLTYSFVHGKLMAASGTDPDKWAYHIRNAISPDLQYYRTALVPSLLAKVHSNLKSTAGSTDNEFAIYEIGKVHVVGHMEEGASDLPKQMRRFAFVFAADAKTESNKYIGSAFYAAKKYLDEITRGKATYEPLENTDYPITSSYAVGRSAVVKMGDGNGEIFGVIGELHASLKKQLKLPDFCAAFEIDMDILLAHTRKLSYSPLSQYPSLSQDLTLEVPSQLSWSHVYDFVYAEASVAAAEDGLSFSLEPIDVYSPQSSEVTRFSFRLHCTHIRKTLKTEEVNRIMDHIAAQATHSLTASRV